MKISPTQIATYMRCRRQWHLTATSRLNLTPIIPGTALTLGSLVHAALQQWTVDWYTETPQTVKGAPIPDVQPPKDAFLRAAQIEQERIVSAYRLANGYNISSDELVKVSDAITMGFNMMDNYERKWKQPLPPDFIPLMMEQQVTIAIPGTMHDVEYVYDDVLDKMIGVPLAEPEPHYLVCKIDGVLLGTQTGKIYNLERKTYGQRPREEVLRSNSQFLTYDWAMLQLGLRDAQGDLYPVAGTAYDGMWKRAAPPKGSTLDDLFCRVLINRPPEELIEYGNMLTAIANEMANNPAIYINRTSDGSCFWGCGMNTLCLAMSRGEDVDYVRATQYMQRAAAPLADDTPAEDAA